MSNEKCKALKSLKNDDSIIIVPADKGNTTVVIDTDEYDRKTNDHSSDNNTYSIFSFC